MIKRRIKIIILSVLAVICLIFAGTWIKFLNTPLITAESGYKYTVQPGNTIRTVINDLYYKDIVHNRYYLYLLVRYRGDGHDLKAGEYFFPKGTTPSSMLNQMVTAKGLVYHSFTIVPGWTFKDLRQAIVKETLLRHALQSLTDQEVMNRLGHPNEVPEGQFFPDTYYFAEGVSDFVLLKQAFAAMQRKLHTAWQERSPGLPYKTPYEILIAASLIEKEAYLNEERPIISGVLVNRLHKDMLLQVDPTVIYGMGLRYDGKIRKEDLQENTPYNTYVNKGLPPAPIAMPSLESIMAAVHPQNNEYLYYVARGDGSHQFSTSYIEHQAAIMEVNKVNPWFFNRELLRYHLRKVM